MISMICLVAALVLFLIDSFGVNNTRINLQSLGLAFLTLSFLLGSVGVLR